MNLQARRLLALLDYAQESMRTRSRAVSNVREHGGFLLFDHQVEAFGGVRAQSDASDADEQAWLTVPHPLSPQVPPEPGSSWLVPWLSIGAAVEATPGLADEIDGAALIAAGTHRDSANPAVDLASAADPVIATNERVRLRDYQFREEVERQYALYLQAEWKPWAEREQRRRRLSHLYSSLFSLRQQLSGALTENQLELVWGMAIATLKSKHGEQKDNPVRFYPLLTRAVDITFDEESGSAQIRPRNVDARLELEAFVSPDEPAVQDAEKAVTRFLSETGDTVTPFDPESYAPLVDIAREAIGPQPERQLEVANGWVFSFVRAAPISLVTILSACGAWCWSLAMARCRAPWRRW